MSFWPLLHHHQLCRHNLIWVVNTLWSLWMNYWSMGYSSVSKPSSCFGHLSGKKVISFPFCHSISDFKSLLSEVKILCFLLICINSSVRSILASSWVKTSIATSFSQIIWPRKQISWSSEIYNYTLFKLSFSTFCDYIVSKAAYFSFKNAVLYVVDVFLLVQLWGFTHSSKFLSWRKEMEACHFIFIDYSWCHSLFFQLWSANYWQ